MTVLSKRERVSLAIAGEAVDRPPYAFWGHHPPQDQTPEGLAAVQLRRHDEFGQDLIKVMFHRLGLLEDLGVGLGELVPVLAFHRPIPSVRHPDDWARVPVLDPRRGRLAGELEAVRLVRDGRRDDAPVLASLLNPITIAAYIAGPELLLAHLRERPDRVAEGLERITLTLEAYVDALGELGIDGVFYAADRATSDFGDEERYAAWTHRLDLRVLARAGAWSSVTVLHLHGTNVFFEQQAGLPVDIINWHSHETRPPLEAAALITPRAVAGGVQASTLLHGSPEAVEAEVAAAVAARPYGLVLTPECVIGNETPARNLRRFVEAATALDRITTTQGGSS
jgi:uroporphyrinogen decarboxylase